MNFVLVIYTVVAMSAGRAYVYTERDWRPVGEFRTEASCDEARRLMGYDLAVPKDKSPARCLPK